MSATILYKHPTEVRQYGVDFGSEPELVAGETLAGSPTAVPTLLSGTGTLTITGTTYSGTKAVAVISGGESGDIHSILWTVTTSAGRVLVAREVMEINLPPAT